MDINKIIKNEYEELSEEMTDGYLFSNIPPGMDWDRIFMGGLDEDEVKKIIKKYLNRENIKK